MGRSDTVGNFTPAAEVYDEHGVRVGLAPAVSASGHAVASAIVQMPATGVYSVLVSGPADGSAGTFTVATTLLNRPCSDQTIECSAILDGSVSGLLRNRFYSLNASANDTFLIRLLQPDPSSLFRPHLDVYDSAGTLVKTSDSGASISRRLGTAYTRW